MISQERGHESGYAIQQFAFECSWCSAINDSVSAEWCACVSERTTMTCATCGRCFCDADASWRNAFFSSDAAAVFRKRAEKLGNAIVASVLRPVTQLPRPVVMIVDDDKVVHVIAKRVLSGIVGTLVHAADGEAAFRLAQEVLPDVVITDALLPKLDGRELSLRLKTTPATTTCKVAVMTALYKGLRYRSEAINRFRVDAYAEKPLTADALRALTTALLPVAPSSAEVAQ